jgi:tetratricopeptide (TPR) repeat protein
VLTQRSSQASTALKAGMVATERSLYFYQTLLQYRTDRDLWLRQELEQIQQQLQRQLSSEGWIGRAAGPAETIAPSLSAPEYVQQRLITQLHQVTQQFTSLSRDHALTQGLMLGCIASVVLVPIVAPQSLVWGALGLDLSWTLLLWLQLSALRSQRETWSQLALGLTLLQDYWNSLPPLSQKGLEFFRLVAATETLLESPYRQVSDQIRQSLGMVQQSEFDLVQQVLSQPLPVAVVEELTTQGQEIQSLEVVTETVTALTPSALTLTATPVEVVAGEVIAGEVVTGEVVTPATQNGKLTPPSPAPTKQPSAAEQRARPHAFIIMPFGRKQGSDGRWIDFNSIYATLIKPAVEEAGFESFRADEEESSGDILTDMFQELLLADLAIADLSIDNANVFYELGIRHAFRKRGVVHIQAGRAYMPFDIFNVRTLPYHCDENGCPDPAHLEKDKAALMKMITTTWKSERNLVHSPVFNLLGGLIEPDRKTLRTPLATGYWQEFTSLQSRITIAQRQKRIGDVVILAEEVSNPLVKEDVLAEAGKALKSMGNSALALKEYRQGLKLNPDNVSFRCEEAYHLSRLGQSDEAIVKLEKVLTDLPTCVEAATYLARIYKDLWKQTWKEAPEPEQRIQIAYESGFLLQRSLENYLRGYRLDQNQYFPGINALMLTALLEHLATRAEVESGDPGELAYRSQLSTLCGSVQFCLDSTLQRFPNDYWAAMSLGDLAVCVAQTPHQVATAYRKGLSILWNNKFGLQATLEQLSVLQLLNFRPDFVATGIAVLQPELDRLLQSESLIASGREEEEQSKPSQVLLFAGHMLDSPTRPKPRFPAAMEPEAIDRLESALDKFSVQGSNCVAIIPGLACGSDILFAEACLRRNVRLEVYLPTEPASFIQESVSFSGDSWVERFYTILNSPNITVHLQPDRLGPVPGDDNPYERNNRWALYSTLMYDLKRVRLITLWNGQGGDGLGGTADMVAQVRQLGGIVEHIDITKFDYWKSPVMRGV